ncbi:hypothetical protein ACN28G_12980 [Micromonospora sp. WMMA1923]|uniref:hypothetical protein n=1 Tax=Micromonospora sp. WMMA1923 TaxID=3404125 RepID=UPI003B9354DE
MSEPWGPEWNVNAAVELPLGSTEEPAPLWGDTSSGRVWGSDGWNDEALDRLLFDPVESADTGQPSDARPRAKAQERARRIRDYGNRIDGASPNSKKAAQETGHKDTYDHLQALRRGTATFSPEVAHAVADLGWADHVVPEGSAGRRGFDAAFAGTPLPVTARHKRRLRSGEEWAARIRDYGTRIDGALPKGEKSAKAIGHKDTYDHLQALRRNTATFSREEAHAVADLGWADHVVPEGSAGRRGFDAAFAGTPLPVTARHKRRLRSGEEWAARIRDYGTRVDGALPDSMKDAVEIGHKDTYHHLLNLKHGRTTFSREEAHAVADLDWADHVVPQGSKGRLGYDAVLSQVSSGHLAAVAAMTTPGVGAAPASPTSATQPLIDWRTRTSPSPSHRPS